MYVTKAGNSQPALEATLTNAQGQPVDLAGAVVTFYMRGPSFIQKFAEVKGEGVVWVVFDPIETKAGTYRAEFEVTYPDGSIETFPNSSYLTVSITPNLKG